MRKKIKFNIDKKFNGSKDINDLFRKVSTLIGGKNAITIPDLLMGKRHVNEFVIAKKLNLTINQTRNILYKLADEGLVSSIRKKDKKKGWYTYFWIFNIDKALLLLKKNILREIDQLEHQLKSRELKRYYVCKSCNFEITEENALLNNFICVECGRIYDLNDNSSIMTEIKSEIFKLEKELKDVESEINNIDLKKQKRLEAEIKKSKKEKTSKRLIKKIIRKSKKKTKKQLRKIKPKKERKVKVTRLIKIKFKKKKKIAKNFKKR